MNSIQTKVAAFARHNGLTSVPGGLAQIEDMLSPVYSKQLHDKKFI